MALVYIGSLRSRSGKNLVTVGLARHLMDDGKKIAFMKPFGASPQQVEGHKITDSDAWVLNQYLGLKQSPGQCCPVVRTQDLIAHSLDHQAGDLFGVIRDTYEEMNAGKDVFIMAGSQHMAFGAMCDVSGYHITEALDAKVVLVDRYENEFYLDNLLSGADRLGDSLAGVIMNAVDLEMRDAIETKVRPFLETEGIKVLGVIPSDDLLGAMSVQVLADLLGAKLLTGQNHMDNLIKKFYIGAMQVRHASKYFSGKNDFGALVGGDRPDMQLAAIEGGAGVLILTGNFYPSDIILSRAEEHNVPVLVARGDTFQVAHRLEAMRPRVALHEPAKIQRGVELADQGIDWAELYQVIGL